MDLFDTAGFPARWFCGSAWSETPWLGWLHILSDVVTCIAYYAVPAVTMYYVAQRRNVKFPPIFYGFLAAIFLTCGTGHLLEAIIFWWPVYRFAAVVKLVTATVSCAGVVMLARILPTALELKSGREFRRVLAERQQAEASLERERFLLRMLLEHLPDAIHFKDADGRFTCVSKMLATRLGCATTRDVLSKSDADFFPADFAAAARADELELMRTGRPMVSKVEHVHWPDQGISWVLTTKVPLRDDAGQIVGTFGISHDVSELKAKEEALRVSEERYALAVRGSTDGIWDWNVSTDDIHYSARFLELLGYDEHEFPNRVESFESRLHPDDRGPTLSAVRAHLEHRTTYDVECRLQTKSGEYRWFRARGQALWNADGRATRMAGSITDITDRHRGEERFRRAVEASPSGMLIVDREGRILLVNSQAESLFGYSRDELIGSSIDLLVPERFRAEHPRHRGEFLANPRIRPMNVVRDLTALRKDGGELDVEIGLSPLQSDEGPTVLCSVMDITERRQTLRALQSAKEAAEASNRAKSEFLANMSHEIRTPMNAVIGMTELLLDSDLSASQREYLSMVLQAGESLLAIINDILDFSKIEAGKVTLEAVDFNLWDLVGDSMRSLVLRAHCKGLELVYHVARDVPEILVSDPIRLRQILVNLVGNAIKFTVQGEVLVDISCVAKQPNGVQLRFAVTDTGIGIPLEKQKVIFDAFTQADNTTTRRFGGTGLGLAISSRLVSLLGGELELESEVGRGSTFFFSAWFACGASQATPHHLSTLDLLKDVEVLIVDDNATNRRILEEMVRSWGLIPLLAASAAEALRQLQQRASAGKPIQLLLTDVHMPETDGLMLVEQIRAHRHYADLPVIVLSSGDRGVEAERCQRLAVAAHLMKPIKQSELLTSIETALSAGQPMGGRAHGKSEELAPRITPLRILLAEDGLTNQKLAVALLTKWGHQVTLAGNGLEAVRAFESQPFDLVIMDVQMPEMDGLEATARIRALEQQREMSANRRIPIVALTARAMKGDRERCLAAGMDGYVAKPIRQRDLYQAIAPYFATTAPVEATPLIVDWSRVLSEVENDRQMLDDLIRTFLQEVPDLMAELESAARSEDGMLVGRAAHKLKSSLQLFAVAPIVELADRIEGLGRAGRLQELGAALIDLKLHVNELCLALRAFQPSAVDAT